MTQSFNGKRLIAALRCNQSLLLWNLEQKCMKKLHLIWVLMFICANLYAVNAQITSVSQLRDVKPTDKYYPALKNLIEKHKAFEPYPDNTLRAEQPITRGEFAKQLYLGLKQKLKEAWEIKPQTIGSDLTGAGVGGGAGWDISAVKDVSPNSKYYTVLRFLMTEYLTDLTNADSYFRPDAPMSQKELFDYLSKLFKATADVEFSQTKIVSRGEWVILMSRAFDTLSDTVESITPAEKTNSLIEARSGKPVQIYADNPAETYSFQSREELMKILNSPNRAGNSLNIESPLTRREFVAFMTDYLDDLLMAAIKKLKADGAEGYFDMIKKNPAYAVSNERSSPTDASYKRYANSDLRADAYKLARLEDLGIKICDTSLVCHFEQPVTEREFYQWIQKIFMISVPNASTSDKPMMRAKMIQPLGDALWASFRKINAFSILPPKTVSAQPLLSALPDSSSKPDIIRNLPSRGRARITSHLESYSPDSLCADLSSASGEIRPAFADGGIRGNWQSQNKKG